MAWNICHFLFFPPEKPVRQLHLQSKGHGNQHAQLVLSGGEDACHYDREFCQLALIHCAKISYISRDCLPEGWDTKQDNLFVIEGMPENNNIFLKVNFVAAILLYSKCRTNRTAGMVFGVNL